MQATASGDKSLSPQGESSTVSEAIESFVEATTDALADAGAEQSAIESVEQSGGVLAETAEELEREVEEARERTRAAEERVEDLEDELKEEREVRAREAAQDRQRLTAVENAVEELEGGGETDDADDTPRVETGRPAVQQPETPLEDVIRVPEHVVEDSLTANQRRARFVAKDAHEYTHSVPAGRAIKSSELRRVLSAREEDRVYTETVSRVIRFLDDLGQEDVKVRETASGERVVVFGDDLVKRIVAWQNQRNGVVTGEGATG